MANEVRRGMQTAEGSLDYDQFTDEINRLLRLAWGDDWGTFTEDEPTGTDGNDVPVPVITFDLESRKRTKYGVKSLEPVHFDTIPDPENPAHSMKLYRQWFDVEMVFRVFHNTNRAARLLMEEFEDFLFTYKSHLKHIGISELVFQEEKKPTVESRWSQKLAARTLLYLVRIERITTVRSNNFVEIETTVKDAKITNPPMDGVRETIVGSKMDPMIAQYRSQMKITE